VASDGWHKAISSLPSAVTGWIKKVADFWLTSVLWSPFSVLTLLVAWQEGHRTCKTVPVIARSSLSWDLAQRRVTLGMKARFCECKCVCESVCVCVYFCITVLLYCNLIFYGVLPSVGSRAYCTLDSFVDFGAIYIVCLASPLTSFLLHLFFVTYLLPCLPFLWEWARSVSRPEVVRGNQSWAFQLFRIILSYSVFCFRGARLFCIAITLVICIGSLPNCTF